MNGSPVFRFAPSPNGLLHMGHAYSALLNRKLADEAGGRLLLRIEDIDLERAEPAYERAISTDLAWLDLKFEPAIRRQSRHLADYASALEALKAEDLIYPAFLSRGDIRGYVADLESEGRIWPRDPDGVPHYPATDRMRSERERRRRIAEGEGFVWRLDVGAAKARLGQIPHWSESGAGPAGERGAVQIDPAIWGDVMLAKRDRPATYHLAVVVDDGIQGVSHVVRGRDLFFATAIHRLLQELLGLPVPEYHHHRLILGPDGRKLSKSRKDASLSAMREAGFDPGEIRRRLLADLECGF